MENTKVGTLHGRLHDRDSDWFDIPDGAVGVVVTMRSLPTAGSIELNVSMDYSSDESGDFDASYFLSCDIAEGNKTDEGGYGFHVCQAGEARF